MILIDISDVFALCSDVATSIDVINPPAGADSEEKGNNEKVDNNAAITSDVVSTLVRKFIDSIRGDISVGTAIHLIIEQLNRMHSMYRDLYYDCDHLVGSIEHEMYQLDVRAALNDVSKEYHDAIEKCDYAATLVKQYYDELSMSVLS